MDVAIPPTAKVVGFLATTDHDRKSKRNWLDPQVSDLAKELDRCPLTIKDGK